MHKYKVSVACPTVNVYEVEADSVYEAEELAWEGHGILIDSYPDQRLNEVLGSKRLNGN